MASGEASNKNCKKSTTTLDDLPPENALNILFRLPLKSLIRSTSVSKTWYSLIVNPNFISQQIHNSISCRDENAVLIVPSHVNKQTTVPLISLVSTQTGIVCHHYEIPFDTKTRFLKLVGSVSGIFCFSDQFPGYMCLWNPCVRKFKCLPSSRCTDVFPEWINSHFAVGFRFHQPDYDYRVVRVVYGCDANVDYVGRKAPFVEVFSSRLNNWREIENCGVPLVTASSVGTTVNDNVYWVDRVKTVINSDEVWIMSFDFNTEVFDRIKLPNDVRYCLGKTAYFKLMKFEGSLSVCVFRMITGTKGMPRQAICIWLMRHEDGIVSWDMHFKVVLEEHAWPLNITRTGRLLMGSLSRPDTSLLSYNLKSKQVLEIVKLLDIVSCTVDTSFVESVHLLEGGDQLFKSAE